MDEKKATISCVRATFLKQEVKFYHFIVPEHPHPNMVNQQMQGYTASRHTAYTDTITL